MSFGLQSKRTKLIALKRQKYRLVRVSWLPVCARQYAAAA